MGFLVRNMAQGTFADSAWDLFPFQNPCVARRRYIKGVNGQEASAYVGLVGYSTESVIYPTIPS